jgi:UDP-GlcNAc:undecaprenyl-phosphate/decaprenyl-phosphate GlcNAc-1-phosphate transferase
MTSFLIVFGFNLGISLVLNKWLPVWFWSLGSAKDSGPEHLRWAIGAKPLTGGPGFAIPVLITLLYLSVFGDISPGIFLFFSACFGIGLWDDMHTLNPWQKLMAQTFCALILIGTGAGFHFFDFALMDAVLTWIWVIAVLNSINMLDNMDGVAAAALLSIISVPVLCTKVQGHTQFVLVACIAAVLGFLWYNRHPAKIFMGDSGSHLLGGMLIWFSTQSGWNGITVFAGAIEHVLNAYALMLFPFTDTFLVILSRIFRGKSPFLGGRDHFTHMLVFAAMPQNRIPVFIAVINLLMGFFITVLHPPVQWLLFFVLMFTFSMGWIYYRAWQKHKLKAS